MKRAGWLAVAIALALAAGCEREERRFVQPLGTADPRSQASAEPGLQPGQKGDGLRATARAGGFDEGNSYELQQGKRWFRWYNCVGCHSHGGGGMGPALMDESWIYGSDPDSIFATIMEGRPNGMPSFRGRLTEAQAWQLVGYVRALSGIAPKQATPNRADAMEGAPPESRRKPTPDDRKPPK